MLPKIEEKLSLDAIEDVEEHLKQLIERDEFEEKNYQLLMRLYQQGIVLVRSSKLIISWLMCWIRS